MTFDWAGIVAREGAALGAAAGVDPGAPVPAAPGWDTTELLRHAEQAVVRPVGPIEAEFAVDGTDEVLSVFVPTLGAGRSPGDGRTVHLHATDAEGEWLIRFDQGDVVVEAGHAKGNAAVRGRAGELLLWLWGRLPLDELEVFGARDAAEALRNVTTF